MQVTPFAIDVDQATLDDLDRRLRSTRWPDASPAGDWVEGTDLQFLRDLVDYWRTRFDWRAQQSMLNRLPQYTAEVDGLDVHFLHQRGTGPDPYPLVLGHGWPGTNFDLRRLVPLLTDPGAHGADPLDAFDVVVPSLPGFGFTGRATRPGTGPEHVAGTWVRLMAGLGYERFGAHAGDWGAAVAMWLASRFPERLSGLHLSFVPGLFRPPLGDDQRELSAREKDFTAEMAAWFDDEGGYHRLQSTRPQTPAYALNDSPVGLAAWIVEKMRSWSDCHGTVEEVFTPDDILTNVSLYWFTETIGSSMRFYRENRLRPNRVELDRRVVPPLGMARFPADLAPPREWLERVFDVTRYEVMPYGGHFGAWEAPELLAAEIRTFFQSLRS